MEGLTELVYQFFHGQLFLILVGGALVISITSFRSCLLSRKEKNQKEFQKQCTRLMLATGVITIAYLFYIRAFFDLDNELLNIIFIIPFSLSGIIALITWFDRWKLGQKTLDKFV